MAAYRTRRARKTTNRMAAYRPKGRLTKRYSHAVIDDDCMARYLLVGPDRSGSWVRGSRTGARPTIETGAE